MSCPATCLQQLRPLTWEAFGRLKVQSQQVKGAAAAIQKAVVAGKPILTIGAEAVMQKAALEGKPMPYGAAAASQKAAAEGKPVPYGAAAPGGASNRQKPCADSSCWGYWTHAVGIVRWPLWPG